MGIDPRFSASKGMGEWGNDLEWSWRGEAELRTLVWIVGKLGVVGSGFFALVRENWRSFDSYHR